MSFSTIIRRRPLAGKPLNIFIFMVISTMALSPIERCSGLSPLGIMQPNRVSDDKNMPCNFLDSTNITVAARNHSAVLGDFDYEIVNGTYRQPTETHTRACVCLDRPCVRLLCPPGNVYNEELIRCEHDARFETLNMSVLLDDGRVQTISVLDRFGITFGRPACNHPMELDPESIAEDAWQLHENGSISTKDGNLFTQHEYSLNPQPNGTSSGIVMIVLACLMDADESGLRYTLLPIGMLLSVPFLVATFLVYAILPELRNVHGKSLMCYLAGLTVSYSMLSYAQAFQDINSPWCSPEGYLIYFGFMSSFLWLNVISFDLWWNFRHFVALIRGIKGSSKLKENRKFWLYSAYAWGLSLSMTLFCVLMDEAAWYPTWAPGFGVRRCFIDAKPLKEFLYLYLPMTLIFLANATFFGLTASKIRRVQMEMARITSKEDSRRHKSHLEQEKDKYGLFLRLFIVMGITWLMEVVSWYIEPHNWVFYVFDAMNCVQGVVIFALFVVKKKIKTLLVKRWKIWRGIALEHRNSSSNTRMSQITQSTVTTSERSELSLLARSQAKPDNAVSRIGGKLP